MLGWRPGWNFRGLAHEMVKAELTTTDSAHQGRIAGCVSWAVEAGACGLQTEDNAGTRLPLQEALLAIWNAGSSLAR